MLMYAVLEDAITCFQRFSSASGARGRAEFNDAENWLMHEKSDWFFSFEPICEALSLNPDYIRAGLLRWRRNASTRQRKIRLFMSCAPDAGREREDRLNSDSVAAD